MTDDGAELFLTRDNVAETMPKIDALVCHDLPRLVVRPSNKVFREKQAINVSSVPVAIVARPILTFRYGIQKAAVGQAPRNDGRFWHECDIALRRFEFRCRRLSGSVAESV
jgi:hypothetical protein